MTFSPTDVETLLTAFNLQFVLAGAGLLFAMVRLYRDLTRQPPERLSAEKPALRKAA